MLLPCLNHFNDSSVPFRIKSKFFRSVFEALVPTFSAVWACAGFSPFAGPHTHSFQVPRMPRLLLASGLLCPTFPPLKFSFPALCTAGSFKNHFLREAFSDHPSQIGLLRILSQHASRFLCSTFIISDYFMYLFFTPLLCDCLYGM